MPERLYRALLRAYPARLRQRFGDDIVQLHRDRLREARASDRRQPPDPWSTISGWRLLLWDLVVHATGARVRELAPSRSRRCRSTEGDRAAVHRRSSGDFLDLFGRDVRYAWRAVRGRPGLTLVVTLTMALGIGANTAIFSVVSAVLLRPLPYSSPERIVRLLTTWEQDKPGFNLPYPTVRDLRERSHSLAAVAAIDYWPGATLLGGGHPEQVGAMLVSPGFFEILGVRPLVGRFFRPDDDVNGQHRVVVLGHGLWQQRFGGDPAIVGRMIALSGTSYEIVGVAPPLGTGALPGFRSAALWRPLGFEGLPAEERPGRGNFSVESIGRLADGVTLEQANAELAAISAVLEREYPESNTGVGLAAVDFHRSAVGDTRAALLMLLAAVGFVLAVAVANVASLLLAGAIDRDRELAVRMALGAGRAGIVRLRLTESLILAAGGGGAGVLSVALFTRPLASVAAASVPLASRVIVDFRVLAFAAAVCVATGVLCGIGPALRAGRISPGVGLADGTGARRASGGRRTLRLRGALVAAQVALVFVLLVGAGLLVKSYWLLTRVDPGLDPDVVTFRVVPPRAAYPETSSLLAFYGELLSVVRALPGVTNAALVSDAPMSGRSTCGALRALDKPPPPPGLDICAEVRAVTPSYYRVMGIELLRGRPFDGGDTADTERVTIISETTANALWPGEDSLGRQLVTGWGVPRRVVGLVPDVKQFNLDERTPPQTYLPMAQQPRYGADVVLTGSVPLGTLAPSLRQAVWEVDPDLAVVGLGTLQDSLRRRTAAPRFRTSLLTAFAGLALLIAVIGIYGVVSYSVAQRRREIAIRSSLGARPATVVRRAATSEMAWVATGLAVGAGLAAATTRLLTGFLFGVAPSDPGAFTIVALLLLTVGAAASYLPARRAAHVDPAAVLRDG